MPFLELRTPRDMLEKARTEHQRLSLNFNIDNVFNFFVTANHIRDYIVKSQAVDNALVEELCREQDMRDCRDLCDKAKHLRLTRRPDPKTHKWGGAINGAPINTIPLNTDGRWELWSNDRRVDIEKLADRVLSRWDEFFKEHEL